MGQSISSAIKSIDGGDASAKETRDTLNALFALGQSRVDTAYAQAVSDRGNMYAEISKVILRKQSVVCKTSTDTKGIVDGIKGAVGKLMSGQILDGVTDLIQNGLNVVLGQSAGQISSTYTYALVATDLGGFLRIDVDIYNFSLESQGLQSKVQNMTAISSIVSSVNPNSLTAGDIRSIISVSYGGSPLDTQKAILAAVMEAWEMDKKSQTAELTQSDIDKFQSLLVPSKYDTDSYSTTKSLPLQLTASKIDRSDLLRAFERQQSRQDTASGGHSVEAMSWKPLVLWVKLINPAEGSFLRWLGGTLSGFNEDGIFEFKKLQDGVSGDAISLECQVNSGDDQELFDIAVGYVQDTIIPALSTATFLSNWIDTFAMQYDHPTSDNTGLVSQVFFRNNLVTNTTTLPLLFYEPESLRVLLNLAPQTSGLLTGEVNYITAGLPPTDDRDPPNQWVTYETVEPNTVLTGMAITARDLDEGGYQLIFTNSNNKPMALHYNVAWPR